MDMRNSKKLTALGITLAGGALVGSLAATLPASAAPIGNAPGNLKAVAHHEHPHACAYRLGANTLDLTFQGNTFTYPVFLDVSRDGAISGVLFDKYLPGLLPVAGDCNGSSIVIDVTYPLPGQQGQRAEDLVVTPTDQWHGTVAGVWDETGPEAGAGQASFELPLHIAH